MNYVTLALVAASDWKALSSDSGSADGVPRALMDLVQADDDASATDAYWRIDNEVVVQGQLYQAAEPSLEVLLSMACTAMSQPSRRRLVELVQQIVCGEPHLREVEAGRGDLGVRCRAIAREGKWLFYNWLADQDDDVRECALLILAKIEEDDNRKLMLFRAILNIEKSQRVVRTVRQLLEGPHQSIGRGDQTRW